MGLLDWSPAGGDSTDDLSFPNFNAWGPPTSSSSSSSSSTKPLHFQYDINPSANYPNRNSSSTFSVSIQPPPPTSHQSTHGTEAFPSIGMDSATNSSAESIAPALDRKHLSPPQFASSMLSVSHNTSPSARSTSLPPAGKNVWPGSSGSSSGDRRQGRIRSTSFDLFGDDEELQEAESRIGFCGVCSRHCKIHAVD